MKKQLKLLKIKIFVNFVGIAAMMMFALNAKKVAPVSVDDLRNFYSVVIHALREKAERENPKPLTVKQLEKMSGQAVFCVDAKGKGKWALVHVDNEMCTDADFGDWEFYEYGHKSPYGWTAYRTEPDHIGEATNMIEGE